MRKPDLSGIATDFPMSADTETGKLLQSRLQEVSDELIIESDIKIRMSLRRQEQDLLTKLIRLETMLMLRDPNADAGVRPSKSGRKPGRPQGPNGEDYSVAAREEQEWDTFFGAEPKARAN